MSQHHLIQKVFVEITVSNKEKAYQIKDDINSFLSIDVFPEIENHIKTIESQLTGRTLQIPILEVNIDVKNSSLSTELKDKIAELFKEKLSEIIVSEETSDAKTEHRSKPSWVNHQEKMLQTFIFFLENGYMPWWNSDKESMDLLETAVFETIISAPGFGKNMISILSEKHVLDRIIHQLSDKQITQLCLYLPEVKELKINLDLERIQDLSGLNYDERAVIWRLVLEILVRHNDASQNFLREYFLERISKGLFKKNILKKKKVLAHIFTFITENEIAESIKNKEKIKNSEDKNPENITKNGNAENLVKASEIIQKSREEISNEEIPHDGQYVQNAGLILIHPFLKTFFEHCNLLDKQTQQLTDPELCTHLLHYIATGNINAPEYEMIFEKFLCNIPINQSINRHIKLSRKHKAEAKNVIKSVLHNWSPMKKSSPALLQNEFFQRPGKLVVTDYDYTLTVERKTQDILLDRLSWGIGFVKLPWKEKFLLVNW
ncbi:contractile injection system tape measure protein [Chryseobacterium profundimaris]|uniref:Uncharacterized protein n=1 Tax=Chryseobacterium profundimaris TaxID=1387275 RepID=A0ABY1NLZ2_9FLAO|nr:contractile injection system tape measure protein [Chryseobacterium profundimaris]SMP13290.1 hypothetical protein SAMN06264346_102574 [Chryseobacterium profundimaris]